jgi:peptidoglycan/xylan/chitin deacetylase (PgdA/CDA1 family)
VEPTPVVAAPATTEQAPPTAPTPTATPVPLPPTAAPSPTPAPTPTPLSRALAARARIAPPVPRPGAPVVEREIVRGPADRPWVSLTFDAGINRTAYTVAILDALRARGVRGTMFPTGQWAVDNPELMRQMVVDGHDFANHSFAHPDYVDLDNASIAADIRRAEAAILELTGQSTKPFLRPPSGSRNVRVVDVIEAEGYYDIYWTVDVLDWRDETPAAEVFRRAVGGASNGAIIVLHLTSAATAETMGAIVDALRGRGYELVTLSELLAP